MCALRMVKSLGLASKTSTWYSSLHKARFFSNLSSENRRQRLELATTYRTLHREGLSEAICNHITAMAPAADGSQKEVMLIIPHGLHWSEVTPSSLLGLDESNNVVEGKGSPELTAMCIHRGVRSKHNHNTTVHLHAPYSTALGCLKDPTFRMIHQNCMTFYNKVAYDRHFGGFGNSVEEGIRLGEQIGDKNILLMGNHGLLVAAPSIHKALYDTYIFEKCAQFQILAMSTGQELHEIPDDVIKGQYLENEDLYAKRNMDANIRLCQKECDEFENF